MFSLIYIEMTPPPGVHVFQQFKFNLAIFETGPQSPFVQDYFQIGPIVLTSRCLKFFILVVIATKILNGIEIFQQLSKGTMHLTIIPVEFGGILSSALEGGVNNNCCQRRTSYDISQMLFINYVIAYLSKLTREYELSPLP